MGISFVSGRAIGAHRSRAGRGFTLLEVLIVVALIGILVNLAVPAMRKARYRAMAATVVADFRMVERATLQYASDASRYPKDTYPGEVVPELVPYLKSAIPWAGRWDKKIAYDFDNWIRPDGTAMYPACNIATGISIQTKDMDLVAEVNKILKPGLVPCVWGTYTYPISAIGQ